MGQQIKTFIPKDGKCRPVKLRLHSGVAGAESLVSGNGGASACFERADGTECWAVYDLGAPSFGGYPVFKVKSFSGKPVIGISYHDRFLTVTFDEKGKYVGDFKRGSCKYLGVELPVLPANPGRFELYTITRTGEYVFPLIQGQERFVCIYLESGEGSVEIEEFYINYTSDAAPFSGAFSCGDKRLEAMWYAGAHTLNLATIRSDAWDVLNGKLLLRNLSHGNDAGLHKQFRDLKDYIYSVKFSISRNQYVGSGICAYFRAASRKNGYVFRLDLDGRWYFLLRKNNVNKLIDTGFISAALTDNAIYEMSIDCRGDKFTVRLDGNEIAAFKDATYKQGGFGFCQKSEKWAVVYSIDVTADGKKVYSVQSFDDLSGFEYDRCPPFISDGAKRDRLPWSGDLDWAFNGGYYALSDKMAAKETLKLLFRHQNPDGYIYAACYPENRVPVPQKEYGYYESDMFSAWALISLFRYVYLSGDFAFEKKFVKNVISGLDYLLRFVEADGLFNQRYETSKGLWDHNLGDAGKHSYTNMIMYRAFKEGAEFAERNGASGRAALYKETAGRMQAAVNSLLYSKELKGFVKSLDNRAYCEMASSMALYCIIADNKTAAEIAGNIEDKNIPHGKILVLAIRGLYNYGFKDKAFKLLTTPQFVDFGNMQTNVDWLGAADSPDYPCATYECMHFPPPVFPGNANWGDLSHPDTTICGILSGDILGILPAAPGFQKILFKPNLTDFERIRKISGSLKTKYGIVKCAIELKNRALYIKTSFPAKIECTYDFSGAGYPVILNGIRQ